MNAFTRTVRELGAAARDARGGWRLSHALVLAAFVLAALFPLVAPDTVDLIGVARTLQLALAATALAIAVHYGGVPSLGHGAFVGVGAFGAAIAAGRWEWPFVPAVAAGIVAATAFGALAAPALVRLRPALAAAAAWLLAWLVALALAAFPSVTGGAQGLAVPGPPSAALHYEVALVALGLALAALAGLARSAPGLQLSAFRQRPAAARALGAPVLRRLPPLVASASLCGLAGALGVEASGIADAADYSPLLSFVLFAAVFIGGAASVLGPAVGIAILAAVDAAARAYGSIGPVAGERVQPFVAAALVLIVVAGEITGVVRRRPLRATGRSSTRTSARPQPVVVRAEQLEKRYGGVVAADAVDLELRAGEIVALVGPNGSGKTTALRLLAGAIAPDAGRITVDGADVTHAPERARVAAGIVRTLQATALFPELTAFETAVSGAAAHARTGAVRAMLATPQSRRELAAARDGGAAALARVGLERAADTKAVELDAAGQRLLMIAAALAASPRALLLDEPAAGAAREDVHRLVDLLRGLREDGLAVLVVEHDLALVRAVADRVIVMESGRILASGAPGEVWALPAVREAFLGRRANS